VSLAYNIGLAGLAKSSLLKKVNVNPNDTTITNSFMIWNKAGGKVLNGLTKRRAIEAKLYFA
jgi:lysozyme